MRDRLGGQPRMLYRSARGPWLEISGRDSQGTGATAAESLRHRGKPRLV